MVAFLIILVMYIIGALVTAYWAGRQKVDDGQTIALVTLWPVILIIVAIAAPFLWLYERGCNSK